MNKLILKLLKNTSTVNMEINIEKYAPNPLKGIKLLANGFRGLNFTELHTDELHDNTGSRKIAVHEEFNMLNNKTDLSIVIWSKNVSISIR